MELTDKEGYDKERLERRVRNYMVRLLVPKQDPRVLLEVMVEIQKNRDMKELIHYLRVSGEQVVINKMLLSIFGRNRLKTE